MEKQRVSPLLHTHSMQIKGEKGGAESGEGLRGDFMVVCGQFLHTVLESALTSGGGTVNEVTAAHVKQVLYGSSSNQLPKLMRDRGWDVPAASLQSSGIRRWGVCVA